MTVVARQLIVDPAERELADLGAFRADLRIAAGGSPLR
jgi:hypothetical protein